MSPVALLLFLWLWPTEPHPNVHNAVGEKMAGISLVAPPRPFHADPMPPVLSVGANWIAVIPFGFTRPGEARMYHGQGQHQWWGEKPEGVRETIKLAKRRGLHVMLKPQVWIPGSWPGGLDFASEADWQAWERDYRDYILRYARLAEELDVPLFCIGTEFTRSEVKRKGFWCRLIAEVRKVYRGKLTYAANWDAFESTPFWEELDYIGIDAYFPLSEKAAPNVGELQKRWKPIAGKIERFSQAHGIPVIFTEYGYLSVEGCAGKTWELEKNRSTLTVSEEAQAKALEALYRSFWKEDWWAGGFLWKWYPHESRRPGRREKDYTPQGKMAEEVMRKWFGK